MIDLNKIDRTISEKGSDKTALIPILQAIQRELNYLPEEALRRVSETTEIKPAEIIGVASFYSQFRLAPVGEHIVRVCVGTACHVKGAGQVYDALRRAFKLKDGEHTDSSRKYTIEKVSCLGCCTLAPVVQVDHITYGHVTSDKAADIIRDFESQKDTKGRKFFRNADGTKIQGEIRIGLGSCCVASGSSEIKDAVENTIIKTGLQVKLKSVGCVGMCHQVPLVEIVPVNGEPTLYSKVKPEDIQQIVATHFQPSGRFSRLKNKFLSAIENIQTDQKWNGIERYELDIREKHVSSFLGKQFPIATEHRGLINPLDLEEYQQHGGFVALKKMFREYTPSQVIDKVKASGIRGRGGAGFPTGIKWELVSKQESDLKYLICNGDEGDPGAFMDRMLLESYPYRVIEGMIIAAYAVNSREGYFYIRAEYPLAVKRIRAALEICRDNNLIGNNILGSGFDFNVKIYEGAGAFVCGEETALIQSIEGNRGFPHLRPPLPRGERTLWITHAGQQHRDICPDFVYHA